jgi:exonuclease SbcC
MRLEWLELTNFRSYEHLELDLGAVNCAALVGRNGAGKSTIPIAISWALFGGQPDELLRWGEQKGGVELRFTVSGDAWTVKRTRERGKRSILGLVRNGEPLDTHTVRDAQDVIEQLVGFDEDAFLATVYAAQGRAGEIARMDPGQRKALLAGLVGLERYEEWRVEAGASAREKRAALAVKVGVTERLEAEVERLTGQLVDVAALNEDISSLSERVSSLEAELEDAHEREREVERVKLRVALVAEMTQIREQADAEKDREARRAELRGHLSDLSGARAALEAQEALYETYQAGATRTLRERDAALQAAAGHRREAESLWRRLHLVSDGETEVQRVLTKAQRESDALGEPEATCPTCGQAVAGEHKRKARADAQRRLSDGQQRLVELHAQRSEIESQRADARREADEAEAKAAEMPEPEPFDFTGLNAAKRRVEAMVGYEAELAALPTLDVEALKLRYVELRDQARALPRKAREGPGAAEVKTELGGARTELQSAQRRLEQHARYEEEIAAARQEADRQRASFAQDEERAAALEACERAFSRNGIPAMILDNTVGGIEAATNEMLDQLGSAMRVSLVTQAAKKSGGGFKETLEILVDDGANERPLATFSGGEAMRVHLALRLGLAEALSANSGIEPEFMVIDEPTDLDGEGMEVLAELLPKIGRQVLLATHESELMDAMPQRIVVSRDLAPTAPSSLEVN